MTRVIHVDMDAFYASVEQLDNPQLRARPVMVGGRSARGVVAAASYEARQFGVRSAMPAAKARRLCPHGVFLPARFERYREVSARIFAIFHAMTEKVEGLSLDEAYLDVSDMTNNASEFLALGRRLKQDIARDTGLTASVGMASNKLLAKLASDDDKPDGFVLIAPAQVQSFLDPLPVRRLPGVGHSSEQRLNDAGILTVGQLRHTAPDVLVRLFGSHGVTLAARAAGIDERPVNPDRVRRSISQENTFSEDIHDLQTLWPLIEKQSKKVASRLNARSLRARTVSLKLRSTGFSTITRNHSFPDHTADPEAIARAAWRLLEDWSGWRRAFSVRLIGVGVSGLMPDPDALDAEPD